MAKHLIGFGLFLSIVAFFGLAYWVLSIPPIPSLERTIPVEEKSYPTNCYYDGRNRVGKPRAIADRSTGEVTLYINSIHGVEAKSPGRELKTKFTFFAVRGEEIRVVDVIGDSLVRNLSRDNDTKWIVRYEAGWIRGLAQADNVYVVPGVWNGSNFKPAPAAFSIETAIPVLIRN